MADNRDWDKEMAAIDKVISKGGYAAPSTGAPAPQAGGNAAPTPAHAPGVPAGSRLWFGMWVRTLLVFALAFGLQVWPWTRFCGFKLYWFLTATGMLALGSLWVMTVSWKRRSGLAHILGALMLGFALWLALGEILPRTGYAAVHRVWACQVEAPPS